jgi:hypothetical protein
MSLIAGEVVDPDPERAFVIWKLIVEMWLKSC